MEVIFGIKEIVVGDEWILSMSVVKEIKGSYVKMLVFFYDFDTIQNNNGKMREHKGITIVLKILYITMTILLNTWIVLIELQYNIIAKLQCCRFLDNN